MRLLPALATRVLTARQGALLALLAAVVFVLRQHQGRFAFYEDEGLNLLKALMVAKGHALYAEVYSDQAPLFRV